MRSAIRPVAPPPPTAPAGPRAGGRRRLGVASAAVLLAAADTYVVVLVLTEIMRDVGVGIDQLQRAAPIVSGFLLGYVVVLPLLGRLSDLYGRAPVLLGCLGLFAAGSATTAAANDLSVIVAGRTIQGVGGGGLVPVTLALVADQWPPQRRGLPLGAVGAVQELGSVLGPLYGSAVVALSGWRAIFWLNVPVAATLGGAFLLAGGRPARRPRQGSGRPDIVGAALLGLALVAALLAVGEPSALAESDSLGELYLPLLGRSALTTPMVLIAAGLCGAGLLWEATAPLGVAPLLGVRRLPEAARAADWPGALLLGGSLGCVILAFASADPARQAVAGSAPLTLPTALILGAGFCWRELRCPDPLIDLRSLRSPAAAGAIAVNLLVGAALMAALVDIPLFARSTVDATSQGGAALELVRFLAGVPVGAVAGGLVCEALSYRLTVALGMLLSAAMFALMAGWGVDAMAPAVSLTDAELVACGLGFGLCVAPVNAAVLGAMPAALHGLAASLVVVARTMGMLVGLAVLTAIGLRRFYAASATIPSPLRLCPENPASCPAYDHLSRLAVVDELHVIFVGAAVAAGVAAGLGALTLRRAPADNRTGGLGGRVLRGLGDAGAA